MNNFDEILKDLQNVNLPKDLNNINKIKCDLKPGSRVFWYFKEDEDFMEEGCPYSGFIIPVEDIYKTNDLEIDECIICMDVYPTEKENPLYTYFALNRLLDNDELVEIVNNKWAEK